MTRTVADCLKSAQLAVKQAPEHIENWLSLGQFQQLMEQTGPATRSFEQAWAAAADQQRWALYLTAAEQLLELYQRQGRRQEFVMACLRLLKQPWLDSYGFCAETVLLKLGQFYLTRGPHGVALHYLKQALAQAEQQLDKVNCGEAHFLLGQVLRKLEQFDQAEEHFRLALKIASELKQAARMANLYSVLARFYQQREQWQDAETMQAKSIEIGKLLKQQAGVASGLSNLGIVQMKQEHLLQARQSFTEALELYRSLENTAGEADQLTNLGILATLESQLEDAERYLQQAWQHYQTLALPPRIEQVTQLLVNLAQLQKPHATLQ